MLFVEAGWLCPIGMMRGDDWAKHGRYCKAVGLFFPTSRFSQRSLIGGIVRNGRLADPPARSYTVIEQSNRFRRSQCVHFIYFLS